MRPNKQLINDRLLFLKKLYHRSNYRGCKETDLLLGRFADLYLAELSDLQLQEYDYLLNQADLDIYNSIMHPDNALDDFKKLSIWSLLILLLR